MTYPDELVERVARASAKHDAPMRDWSDYEKRYQDMYRDHTRAVLDAAGVGGMLDALRAAKGIINGYRNEYGHDAPAAAFAVQEIDAALDKAEGRE